MDALRILIVDDSASDRKILRRYLRDDPDRKYLVFESETGEEGLELCRSLKLDCLLLDYRLPDTLGSDLLLVLKGDPVLMHLPVVLITGIGNEQLAIECFRRGVQDYINKENLTQTEVSRAIKSAIEHAAIPTKLTHALVQSEERLRLLIEGVREYAIFLLDNNGNVSYWNSGAERLTGYAAAEITGKSLSILHRQDDIKNQLLQNELKIAAREGRHGGVNILVKKDKTEFSADILLTALRDPLGEVRGYAQVMRNISEELKSHNILKITEARLKGLISSNLLGIVFWHRDGEIIEANDAFLKIIGFDRDDLDQKRVNFLNLAPEHLPLFRLGDDSTFSQLGLSPAFECKFLRKDGELKPVLIAAALIESQTIEHVAFVVDLSEYSKVREKLKMSEEGIRQRDEFISVASHELKTPVTSLRLQIQGILKALKLGGSRVYSEEKLARVLNSADTQVEKMIGLVDDLLDVARVRAGQMKFTFEEVDLTQLIVRVAERFNLERNLNEVIIKFDANNKVWGRFDRFRLDQLFTNLISNALKYGLGKQVFIDLKSDDRLVTVNIQDQGMGIAGENHKRIFERFERANPALNIQD
jgi:PAS domain S-box-containing protein